MKEILDLTGTKTLSRTEQKAIKGGQSCNANSDCSNLGKCFICTPINICFRPYANPCGGSTPE